MKCRFCDAEATVIGGDIVFCADCYFALHDFGRKGLSELTVEELLRLENIYTQLLQATDTYIQILQAIKEEIESRSNQSPEGHV
jgi:hypothetical protein